MKRQSQITQPSVVKTRNQKGEDKHGHWYQGAKTLNILSHKKKKRFIVQHIINEVRRYRKVRKIPASLEEEKSKWGIRCRSGIVEK